MKQHIARRDYSGKTLCGIDVPPTHNEWAALETCIRCARARDHQQAVHLAKALLGKGAPQSAL